MKHVYVKHACDRRVQTRNDWRSSPSEADSASVVVMEPTDADWAFAARGLPWALIAVKNNVVYIYIYIYILTSVRTLYGILWVTTNSHMYMYVCGYVCIYIYIYIYRY